MWYFQPTFMALWQRWLYPGTSVQHTVNVMSQDQMFTQMSMWPQG